MARLTLRVDESVAEKAKRLAKENGTSVSAMFTRFVLALDSCRERRIPFGPITCMASGMVRLPNDKTDRELLEEALMEKYGIEP